MVYSNWAVYPVRTHHKNKKGERECIAVWRNPIGVHRNLIGLCRHLEHFTVEGIIHWHIFWQCHDPHVHCLKCQFMFVG